MIEVVEKQKLTRSLQEISKNLLVNSKIEIPSCKLILVSPICSHSLVMKYLFICGILSNNNCVAFCNECPKTELSPAREENTLLTHHNQLSLSNKSCWDCFISILNWRLLRIMPLPIKPLRPRLTRPTRLIKHMRPTRPIRLMWPRTRPTRLLRPNKAEYANEAIVTSKAEAKEAICGWWGRCGW